MYETLPFKNKSEVSKILINRGFRKVIEIEEEPI